MKLRIQSSVVFFCAFSFGFTLFACDFGSGQTANGGNGAGAPPPMAQMTVKTGGGRPEGGFGPERRIPHTPSGVHVEPGQTMKVHPMGQLPDKPKETTP
jgi:hypothetical protein